MPSNPLTSRGLFFSISIVTCLLGPPSSDAVAQHKDYGPQLDSLLTVYQHADNSEQTILLMCRIVKLYVELQGDSAESFALQAIKKAETVNKRALSRAYEAYADVLNMHGDFASAADYFNKAVQILDNEKDSLSIAHRLHAMAYLGGWLSTVPCSQKVDNCSRALDIYSSLGRMDDMARTCYTLGIFLRNWALYETPVDTIGDYKLISRALYYDRMAETYYRQLNNKNRIAASLVSQAEDHSYLNQKSKVRALALKALALHEADSNLVGSAEALECLSSDQIWKGNYDAALVMSKAALQLFKRAGYEAIMLEQLGKVVELHEKKQDYKSAFLSLRRQFSYRDSLFTFNRQNTVAQIQNSYETKLREDKIALLSLESSNHAQQKLLFIVITIALTVALTLSFLIFRNRQRYLKTIREVELNTRVRYEKDRIAHDLHDNIGTQLTSLSQGLNRLVKSSPIEPAKIQSLYEDTNTAITELRDTIWGINKSEVKLQELIDKINNFFWRLRQQRDDIEFELAAKITSGDCLLQPAQAINLLRIVQEAVSNSIKHARASQVRADLSVDDHALTLRIADNGVGFDLHQVDTNEHYGMMNMKKRAEAMGGNLDVSTQRGKGTTVAVVMSIPSLSLAHAQKGVI